MIESHAWIKVAHIKRARTLHAEITAALAQDAGEVKYTELTRQQLVDEIYRINDLLDVQPAPDAWRPQWRHRKRGTEYVMVGRGEVQAEEPLTEAELVAVYRGQDGRLWVRRWAEFHDGRFEELTHYE